MIVDSPALSTQLTPAGFNPPAGPNPPRPWVSTHPIRAFLTSQLAVLALAAAVAWSISPVAGLTAATICAPAAAAGTAYALIRRPPGRHRARR
jgi:hypothetical protein